MVDIRGEGSSQMTLRGEGPTPSTTSNQLINLCQDVLNGNAPLEMLTAALAVCAEGLESAKHDFVSKVEEAGAAHMAALEEEIDDVLDAFDKYRGSLKTLERYLGDRKNQHLTNGIEELTKATFSLLDALAAYEDKELLESGPSDNHYVNLLVRMADRLLNGEVEEELYFALIYNAEKLMSDSLDNLSEDTDTLVKDEINALILAGKNHQEALNLFKDFAGIKDPNILEKAIQQLQEASAQIKEGLARVSLKRLTSGPSKSPHVNLIINALKGFAEEAIPFESYSQAVDDFKQTMIDTHKEFKKLSTVRITSIQMQEEIQRIQDAIEKHDEFLSDLEKTQTAQEAGLVLTNLQIVIEAANTFINAYQSLLALSERENKIVCVRCQHYNPPGSRSCENCHAVLPRIAEMQAVSTFAVQEGGDSFQNPLGEMPITPEMHRLFTAVNQVAEGEIGGEEFLGVVAWMEEQVNTTEKNVQLYVSSNKEKLKHVDTSQEEKEQIVQALEEAQQIVAEGSDIIRNGLDVMRKFIEEPDREYLLEGVRGVWEGFQQIFELHQSIEAVKNTQSQETHTDIQQGYA